MQGNKDSKLKGTWEKKRIGMEKNIWKALQTCVQNKDSFERTTKGDEAKEKISNIKI